MPALFADTSPRTNTGAPTPAAPVAPVVPAAPPPAAPAAETPPPAPFDAKGGAAKLHKMLSSPVEPDTLQPKKEDPAAPAAPATPAKGAEKPIKVVKKKEPALEARPTPPKASDLRKETPAAAPVAPAPAAIAATEVDDATFEKSLSEEERVLLEDARDADRLLSAKYKDQSAKMTKFLREAAKKEKDIEAGDLTEAKYEEWYKANLPRIGALDQREIVNARATEAARRDLEPKLEEERHTRWKEAEAPKVSARGKEARAKIWESALPKSVLDVVDARLKDVTDPKKREELLADARKEFALELEVATGITDAAAEGIEEFYALTTVNPTTGKALKALKPDAEIQDPATGEWVPNLTSPDPETRRQATVLAMISDVCEAFKTSGGLELKKDGKWFATRAEWGRMTPEQRAGWWTFKDDEIVARAQSRIPSVIEATIKQRIEHLEARGFKRPGSAAPAVPAAPAAPVTQPAGAPPAPRVAPPPSGSAAQLTPVQAQAQALARQMESKPAGT